MNLKRLAKIFFISLLGVINVASFSQNVKFKKISIDDGLSQASVNALFQDSEGFVWIGTQDGLNRYDGYHIKAFKTDQNNENSLSSNEINCLFEDQNGIIFIGTNDQGLSVYNKYTKQFTNYKAEGGGKKLPDNSVRCIEALNDNELLIATDKGLSIFNKTKKTFNTLKVKGSIVASNLKYIFKDNNGFIWIASFDNGLFKLDDNHLTHFPIPENTKNKFGASSNKKHMRCITQVNGNLWCGTDDGVVEFNPTTKKYIASQSKLNFNNQSQTRIVSFAHDKVAKYIWIGTWDGLVKYDITSGASSIFKNNELDRNSLSNDKVSCLMTDNQQNIWIGTQDKGVNIYFSSSIKFPLLNKSNGLENDFVYSIMQSTDKNIWIGTEGGLTSYNPQRLTFENYDYILKKYKVKGVLSLYQDNLANIWIGTYGQGVIVYNPKTKFTKQLLGESSESGTVVKIIQDKRGIIWIGTYANGLYAINPTNYSIKNYNKTNGLPSNKIYCIYENKNDNTIWVGTDGFGFCILKFDANSYISDVTKFTHKEQVNSISSNVVNNIRKDYDGVFWIATANGLNRFDYSTKKFVTYYEQDGIANSYIYDVLPDTAGNLWLPTNMGLTKFDPKSSNENGIAFKNYSTKDGIQANEFNQGASFLCSDGHIIVGGVAGINYFDPSEIKENNNTPKSYLYEFSRQGKVIDFDTNIIYKNYVELSHKENYFSVEFIALDFVAAEKTKYMFMLDGYDDYWTTPSNVRFYSYTELPGGTYTFKVKACNSDGVWNELPQKITIKVIPPWYRTPLFYILATMFVVAFILGFISYRTRSIKKENKILERKVTERTHELAEKNRNITSSIEYAKLIQEAILPSKELIYSKFKKMFIFYKPKDIVSGDFYWFGEKGNYKILAVVDCTGHGVPGAFMSMIGHNLLNQIISEKGIFDPGIILQELHKGIQSALKQGQNQVQTNDGMDVSMIAINTETNDCLWAGAFRSLVIINSENKMEKIEGNKYSVGGSQIDSNRVFTTHIRTLQPNDVIYMFTDGYADQFGGPNGKKFMAKRFYQNLKQINKSDIHYQAQELESQFNEWKHDEEQVDDILVVGIKI
jgi:ligand-binding sensor domain-containing protein/serine phosphatase RsbU (regulator of sigma subunit)